MKPKAAFFSSEAAIERVYGGGRRERVAALTNLLPEAITSENFEARLEELSDIEVIFTTWGMPALTAQQIARMPALRAVFYAAGSVKAFARPFLERGITVASAWAANAVPVAEFTLAQILLSCKGYFRNTVERHTPGKRRQRMMFVGNGSFHETVALIGFGMIGQKVVAFLAPFDLNVLVVSEHLGREEAHTLGVRKVSLEEAFREGCVVSNYLPNRADNQQVLNGKLFRSMRRDATFINAGRGAQVDEPALIEVLKERPDLTALLDVTDPEPPAPGSELYTLPNVHLTSHISGSLNNEVVRMADYAISEFEAWQSGRPLKYAVTLEMLEWLA